MDDRDHAELKALLGRNWEAPPEPGARLKARVMRQLDEERRGGTRRIAYAVAALGLAAGLALWVRPHPPAGDPGAGGAVEGLAILAELEVADEDSPFGADEMDDEADVFAFGLAQAASE